MKRLALAACIITAACFLIAFPLYDAVAATPAPPPPAPTTTLELSADDLLVLDVALRNAGMACDAGVRAYCGVAAARDEVRQKVMAGAKAVQAEQK